MAPPNESEQMQRKTMNIRESLGESLIAGGEKLTIGAENLVVELRWLVEIVLVDCLLWYTSPEYI